MNSQIPEQDDPHVGTTYGNILDQYDSPTYSIKLYMIREGLSLAAPAEFSSFDERLIAKAGDTVVLAQTAVTGTTIDNVEVHTLATLSGPVAQKITFSIEQPGAANFIDQIQLAKAYLGHKNAATVTLFMEISFQGYTESSLSGNWDPDTGGQLAKIAGPYRYKMQLTKLEVAVDAKGSKYDIECVSLNTSAFRDNVFKIPNAMFTTGSTIQEHVNDLQTKLNEAAKRGDGIPNEYKFDTSQLIGSSGSGQESLDKILTPTIRSPIDNPLVERGSTSALNSRISIRDAADLTTEVTESLGDYGLTAESLPSGTTLFIEKGVTIESYFIVLLSMNDEMVEKVSRRAKIDDPESKINTKQAFTSWIKVSADVAQGPFDESQNEYSLVYTYTPLLYKDARSDVAVDAKELEISVTDGEARIEQLKKNNSLLKKYEYFFTGRNDQILNLDIKYDPGVALLLAPKGGTLGEFSTGAAASLAPAIPVEKDITEDGLKKDFFSLAETAISKDRVSSFFNKLTQATDEVRTGFVEQLSNSLSLPANQIVDAVTGANALNQEALINFIAAQGVRIEQANRQFDSNAPSTEPASTRNNADGTVFQPEFSGTAYASDLFYRASNDTDAIDAQTLIEKGYVQVENDTVLTQSVTHGVQQANKVKTAAYEQFTPKNALYGSIASQHADQTFLLSIDLTLRGDPWYLGQPGFGGSTFESANFNKDDNCFWLRIQSPVAYDPDTDDEDSSLNSGYWNFKGVSQTFSGVYRMTRCVNSFSGGLYSVDVQANRILPYEKVPPKTEKTREIVETGAVGNDQTDNGREGTDG